MAKVSVKSSKTKLIALASTCPAASGPWNPDHLQQAT
jgi:hypothetical protein